jgi:hypothetical protein
VSLIVETTQLTGEKDGKFRCRSRFGGPCILGFVAADREVESAKT